MAVPIKSSNIYYLEKEILDSFSDVCFVSNGVKIPVNSLVLSAFSDIFASLSPELFDEKITVITEFTPEENDLVAKFVMEGVIPHENLTIVRETYSHIFAAFGINLERVFGLGIPKIKQEIVIESVPIKTEIFETEETFESVQDQSFFDEWPIPEDFQNDPEIDDFDEDKLLIQKVF